MNNLDTSYRQFLTAAGAADESGTPRVHLGDGLIVPNAGAVESLAAGLKKSLAGYQWIIRVEVGLVALLFITLLVLVALFHESRTTVLASAGISVAAIMGVLQHLRTIWKEVTETEIVIGMADNLPPADVLRFIEMRISQRKG